MYYFKKEINWLPSLFIVASLLSCNTQDMLPSIDESISSQEDLSKTFQIEEIEGQEMSYRLGNWNMIYDEAFEGSEPFYCYVTKQIAASHSLTTVTSPKLKGLKSGRFELRKDDPMATSSGKRAEILFERAGHKERWYSYGLFLPSSGFAKDSNNDILSQWHQGGDTSPSISFRVLNDRFLFRYVDEKGIITNHDLGSAIKDVWNQYVFHIIHSSSSDGLVEIWKNGNKIFTKSGKNMHSSTSSLPYFKIGIYKPIWEKQSTDTDLRILYFDNVRIGNENATYSEMIPSTDNLAGWGPFVPDITSLKLINADANKLIREISNNDVFNIRELGTNRISLKAEIDNSFEGSVKFDLKGPKTEINFDNEAPFALFKDDGNGNYYNSGGLPKGNYTLIVTPYDSRNGRGKEGKPVTINFKVVDEASVATDIPSISSFSLIKANTDMVFSQIKDKDVISLALTGTDKLSIRANLPSTFKGSVNFKLSGRVNRSSSATTAPYTIYNYSNGDYSFGGIGLPIGSYTLEATPVYESSGVIKFGETSKIAFQVISVIGSLDIINGSLSTSNIQGFTLIKANTNSVLGAIQDKSVFLATQLGTHKLTIRAEMSENFSGRVQFELKGKVNRTSSSSSKPYVLNNFENGNYTFGTGLPVGSYTLIATPYTKNSLNQDVKGKSETIQFTIK